MEKTYDDTNWREEYKSYTSNKRYIELLENGPKSLSQAWLLGALHNEWKKMKGYDKLNKRKRKWWRIKLWQLKRLLGRLL